MVIAKLTSFHKKLLLAIATTFGVAAVIAVTVYTSKPLTDARSAHLRAMQLVSDVGGTSKISAEASQVFKRFGTSEPRFLTARELGDYPALAGLGAGHVVIPGNPPRISIKVGSHRDGFFFEIPDTNSSAVYEAKDTVRLPNSEIFVHR